LTSTLCKHSTLYSVPRGPPAIPTEMAEKMGGGGAAFGMPKLCREGDLGAEREELMAKREISPLPLGGLLEGVSGDRLARFGVT
jgi:hypothetical protein